MESGYRDRVADAAGRPPAGHPDSRPTWQPSPYAVGLIVAFGVVWVTSWVVTVLSANSLNDLLGRELSGAVPTEQLAYFSLVAVMMVAMMLPAALPMLTTYHGLARLDSTAKEANVRTLFFSLSYFFVWAVFTALVLVVVMGLGLMGGLPGLLILIPGGILVGAGIYQFTSWKQSCLARCQSPIGFLIGRWRSGRRGALRLGLSHAGFCLGCCWLLMLVVFVTGAMGLLWMGVVTGLVLAEKVAGTASWISRGVGVGAVAGGGVVLALALGL